VRRVPDWTTGAQYQSIGDRLTSRLSASVVGDGRCSGGLIDDGQPFPSRTSCLFSAEPFPREANLSDDTG
jgi:hypothetical protein